MGFKVPKRIAVLEFDEASGFQGAEIRCRLDITTEAFFQVEALREAATADNETRIREMLTFFVDNIALEWNLEDEETGKPYPLTVDTLMRELPPALTLNLIPLWKNAAVGVSAPLVEPSPSLDPSPENSIPTPENPSESPLS